MIVTSQIESRQPITELTTRNTIKTEELGKGGDRNTRRWDEEVEVVIPSDGAVLTSGSSENGTDQRSRNIGLIDTSYSGSARGSSTTKKQQQRKQRRDSHSSSKTSPPSTIRIGMDPYGLGSVGSPAGGGWKQPSGTPDGGFAGMTPQHGPQTGSGNNGILSGLQLGFGSPGALPESHPSPALTSVDTAMSSQPPPSPLLSPGGGGVDAGSEVGDDHLMLWARSGGGGAAGSAVPVGPSGVPVGVGNDGGRPPLGPPLQQPQQQPFLHEGGGSVVEGGAIWSSDPYGVGGAGGPHGQPQPPHSSPPQSAVHQRDPMFRSDVDGSRMNYGQQQQQQNSNTMGQMHMMYAAGASGSHSNPGSGTSTPAGGSPGRSGKGGGRGRADRDAIDNKQQPSNQTPRIDYTAPVSLEEAQAIAAGGGSAGWNPQPQGPRQAQPPHHQQHMHGGGGMQSHPTSPAAQSWFAAAGAAGGGGAGAGGSGSRAVHPSDIMVGGPGGGSPPRRGAGSGAGAVLPNIPGMHHSSREAPGPSGGGSVIGQRPANSAPIPLYQIGPQHHPQQVQQQQQQVQAQAQGGRGYSLQPRTTNQRQPQPQPQQQRHAAAAGGGMSAPSSPVRGPAQHPQPQQQHHHPQQQGSRSASSHPHSHGPGDRPPQHQHHRGDSHPLPATSSSGGGGGSGGSSSRAPSEILKTLLRKKACLYEPTTSHAIATITWLVGRNLTMSRGYFTRQSLQAGVHAVVNDKIEAKAITRTKVNRCMQIILNSCFHYIIPRVDGSEEDGSAFSVEFIKTAVVGDDETLLESLPAPWTGLSVPLEIVAEQDDDDDGRRSSGGEGAGGGPKRSVLLCFNENVRSAQDVFRCHNEFIRDAAHGAHLQLSAEEWKLFFSGTMTAASPRLGPSSAGGAKAPSTVSTGTSTPSSSSVSPASLSPAGIRPSNVGDSDAAGIHPPALTLGSAWTGQGPAPTISLLPRMTGDGEVEEVDHEGRDRQSSHKPAAPTGDVLGELTPVDLGKFRNTWCSKRYEHDLSVCGFAHVEINDGWLRRDPLLYQYKGEMCPDIIPAADVVGTTKVPAELKGCVFNRCPRGKACHMAHSREEVDYHPDNYKKTLCQSIRKCQDHPQPRHPCKLRDVCPLLHPPGSTQPREHHHHGHHHGSSRGKGSSLVKGHGAPPPAVQTAAPTFPPSIGAPMIYIDPAPISEFDVQLQFPGLQAMFRRRCASFHHYFHKSSSGHKVGSYHLFSDNLGLLG